MKHLIFIYILCCPLITFSQTLQSGFDKNEYRELMLISAHTTAAPDYYKDFPAPSSFKMVYQSKPVGLDNLWDFWTNDNNIAVISIRGTTEKPESWLANFYAAMVPAKGEIKSGDNDTFRYELAVNPKAAVHVGWLLGMAYLSKEIIPKINEEYQKGTRGFIIVGHSQGGAISFLLTAHLYNLQRQNALPADIRFKTYCSAAPKPGNLYFAYEYEVITQGGWAFNVVNAADWVPEMPISIQTLNDFNNVNPFTNAKSLIKKQKFPDRFVLKHIYNQLDKPTKKAQRRYERYLGDMASKIIKQNIKGYIPPEYYSSNHYVRTGATIVLLPDDEYFRTYPDDPTKLFPHHLHGSYLALLEKLPEQNTRSQQSDDRLTKEPESKDIIKAMIPESRCYALFSDNDTILLKAEVFPNVVTGILKYRLSEKDKNTGTLEGRLYGDTLIADYTFYSEGRQSVRQVAFVLGEDKAIEGYGDIKEKEGKFVFKDISRIDFSNGTILYSISCSDYDEQFHLAVNDG